MAVTYIAPSNRHEMRRAALDDFLKTKDPAQLQRLFARATNPEERCWLEALLSHEDDAENPNILLGNEGLASALIICEQAVASTDGLSALDVAILDGAFQMRGRLLLSAAQARRTLLETQFLNITSHNLRSPMVTIQGYIDMMLRGALGSLTSEQEHGLRVALRNTRNLTEQLETLLDFTRIEQGRLALNKSAVPIADAVRQAAAMIQRRADQKKLVLHIDLSQSEGASVYADTERLSRALRLLMDNAVRYTSNGTVSFEAIIRPSPHNKGTMEFSVRDTGCGIAPEHIPHLCDPFYQIIPDARTAGIGLTLAKALIESHGATLHIESTLGQGSRFWFAFQLA